MSRRTYWEEIREIRAGLPEFVWVVAGRSSPVQTGSEVAARLLHAKTHRLATDDEVSAHRAVESAWNRQQAEDSLRREGVAVVVVPACNPVSDS